MVVVVMGVVIAALLLPVGDFLLIVAERTRAAGIGGAILFGLVYVIATIAFLPASALTIAAGFSYGIGGGIAIVWPSSVVGAVLAFVLGRYTARGWVTKRVAQNPRLVAIDAAIADRAFPIIMLLRLSPLFPFNFLNYFLGITRASISAYSLATVVGMLPGILLYVYLGSIVTSAIQLASGNRPDTGIWGTAFFSAGLVATLAVTIYISRLAKRSLAEATPEKNS